jgi:hypothetical protein
MALGSAEYQCLFFLVNLLHKELYAVAFPLFYFDGSVEVFFLIHLTFFNLAFNDLIIRCVNIIIQRGRYLLDLKRGQEAIVNAFFEGIDINRLTEITEGIGMVFS